MPVRLWNRRPMLIRGLMMDATGSERAGLVIGGRWFANLSVRIEPRDLWVGLFWTRKVFATHFYVCPLPCVVVHWTTGRLRVGGMT